MRSSINLLCWERSISKLQGGKRRFKVSPFTVEIRMNFSLPKLAHHSHADIVFDSILKYRKSNFLRILFICLISFLFISLSFDLLNTLEEFSIFHFRCAMKLWPEYSTEKFHGRFRNREEKKIYFNTYNDKPSPSNAYCKSIFPLPKMMNIWKKNGSNHLHLAQAITSSALLIPLYWSHRKSVAVAYRSVNSDSLKTVAVHEFNTAFGFHSAYASILLIFHQNKFQIQSTLQISLRSNMGGPVYPLQFIDQYLFSNFSKKLDLNTIYREFF